MSDILKQFRFSLPIMLVLILFVALLYNSNKIENLVSINTHVEGTNYDIITLEGCSDIYTILETIDGNDNLIDAYSYGNRMIFIFKKPHE